MIELVIPNSYIGLTGPAFIKTLLFKSPISNRNLPTAFKFDPFRFEKFEFAVEYLKEGYFILYSLIYTLQKLNVCLN